MKYSSFEEWFDEVEGYGLRSERCIDELSGGSIKDPRPLDPRIEKWLRAAFDAARDAGGK
jgi:hypothetical protein